MNNSLRAWIFRILLLIGAGLFLASWFMPWWQADISQVGKDVLTMHPYGLEHNLAMFIVIVERFLPPFWLTIMGWCFFGVVVLVFLYSLWLRKEGDKFKYEKFIIPGLGLVYIIYGSIAIFYAIYMLGKVDIPFLGYVGLETGDVGGTLPYETGWEGHLRIGTYLFYGSGLYLMIIGLLRNKIIGKTSTKA
ncbi:MAG: hypothetical protein ACOWWR_10780 [Eubacteriales bacterium]